MNDFIHIIQSRGFIQNASDHIQNLGDRFTGYIGFDCTAKSLHVGSLIQIMILKWMLATENHPIILIGGGTTKIGDPSGKDKTRPILSEDNICDNKRNLSKIFSKFIDPTEFLMIDNDEWLSQLNYVDFLRDVGRHFSVNRMLSMSSVKNRIEREQEMSFLEFNYMLCQAYDFVELNKRHGCTLQLGGSDQWGNIVNGIDLGRKMGLSDQLYGIVSPLITTANGNKMGKTENGAVWLDAELYPVFDYWTFWRNCDDRDVIRFLKLFTEIDLDEISKFENVEGEELNEAKILLANETTALLHGRIAAEQCSSGNIENVIPTIEISLNDFSDDCTIGVLALFKISGLTNSIGEARRFVKNKGLKIDGVILTDNDANQELQYNNLQGKTFKMSVGKNKYVNVIIV